MTSHDLERLGRELADQTSDRFEEIPPDRDLLLTVNGTAPLTVSWIGGTYPGKRLEGGYPSPTVGDWVLCRSVRNQLIVLGKVV